MKNHPVLSPTFRLILVGVILLTPGTSFSSPGIKAQYATALPAVVNQGPENPFTVSPYPAQAHEPIELGVILANPGDLLLTRYAQFYYSSLNQPVFILVRNPYPYSGTSIGGN